VPVKICQKSVFIIENIDISPIIGVYQSSCTGTVHQYTVGM